MNMLASEIFAPDCCSITSMHRKLTRLFREHGNKSPALDSRLLICNICNIRHEQFIATPDLCFSPEQMRKLENYVQRRLEGEPVSRIFGKREFWSHSFALNNYTLDPRPDTETLVSFTLELLSERLKFNKHPRILDLGTGSGCVILSLLTELELAYGMGIDISYGALCVARENAKKLGMHDRVDFIQTDWLSGIKGKFDIIISNPPYIPTNDIDFLSPEVRCYDPLLALDGGRDGLDAYRKITRQSIELLKDGAFLVFEIGANQDSDVKNLLMSYKTGKTFSNISYKCDLTGYRRCIAAEIKNETCGC